MPSSLFFGYHNPGPPLRNSRRCWRRGGRAPQCEGGWALRPRRSGSGQGDFSPRREGARAYARTTSPLYLSTPHRTLPRSPPAPHHVLQGTPTHPSPRFAQRAAFTDRSCRALPCGQGHIRDALRVLDLLAYRRAPGWRGRPTFIWLALESTQCHCAAKKNAGISDTTRVQWACVRACAMCRASRARSDACPLTI